MTTIKDIAKLSGFSIATVSMVLNNKTGITEPTRKKVLQIANDLHYRPSISAQALKTRRSRALGLIIGQLENPYGISLMTAAEEIARSEGYNIFICNAEMNCDRAIECLNDLKSRDVDGALISLAVDPTSTYLSELHRLGTQGMSIVSLSQALTSQGMPTVTYCVDDQLIQLLNHLVNLGHRYIGMVSCKKGNWLSNRANIFSDVMKAHGLFNEDYIVYAGFDIYVAKEYAVNLLTRHPEITAILGVNDMVAIGVLEAANQLGIKVPEQLSIIGIDGIPYVNFTTPKLATIVTPVKQIGLRGTRKLIDIIEGRDLDRTSIERISCEIAMNGSIAPPRSKSQ